MNVEIVFQECLWNKNIFLWGLGELKLLGNCVAKYKDIMLIGSQHDKVNLSKFNKIVNKLNKKVSLTLVLNTYRMGLENDHFDNCDFHLKAYWCTLYYKY